MKDLKITKGDIEGLIKDWEQFKFQNWYESDAVDVESYLRSEFAEIAARRLLYRMRDLLPPELLKQNEELREALKNISEYPVSFGDAYQMRVIAEQALKNSER